MAIFLNSIPQQECPQEKLGSKLLLTQANRHQRWCMVNTVKLELRNNLCSSMKTKLCRLLIIEVLKKDLQAQIQEDKSQSKFYNQTSPLRMLVYSMNPGCKHNRLQLDRSQTNRQNSSSAQVVSQISHLPLKLKLQSTSLSEFHRKILESERKTHSNAKSYTLDLKEVLKIRSMGVLVEFKDHHTTLQKWVYLDLAQSSIKTITWGVLTNLLLKVLHIQQTIVRRVLRSMSQRLLL
jgi:hypothetical protein